MPAILWRFLILVAIPLAGIALAENLIAVRRFLLIDTPYFASNMSAASIATGLPCARRDFAELIFSNCVTFGEIRIVTFACLVAIAITVFLLLTIRLSAVIAGTNRRRLAMLFVPGMWLTITGLIVVILLNVLFLSTSFYVIAAFIFGGVPILWIAVGVILGLAAGYMVIAEIFSVAMPRSINALAENMPRSSQPELWECVENIAHKLDARRPDHIVCGLTPVFYATAFPVKTVDRKEAARGEILFLSLPLMRVISVPEFVAIVGHELSHFKGEDSAYSRYFMPVYINTVNAFENLVSGPYVAGLPAIVVLGDFLGRFALAERQIRRRRELEADRGGAKAAGQDAIASALIRTSAAQMHWRGVVAELRNSDEGSMENASHSFETRYTAYVAATPKEEILGAIAQSSLSHPVDSHPPLADRLQQLGFTGLGEQELVESSGSQSILLVADHESIEKRLTFRLKHPLSHFDRLSDFANTRQRRRR